MIGSLTTILDAVRQWAAAWLEAWDRFWFAPRLPHTLGLLRIAVGAMLLYSHLVLASDLTSFLGEHAWVSNETARQLHDGTFGGADAARSYLWHLQSPAVLWAHHLVTIVVTVCFAIGFLTRMTAPAAWFLQLMYLHRLTGALFGLDQIVTYCAMYLMLAPCGSCFSIDAWIRSKFGERIEGSRFRSWMFPLPVPSIAANIATRLLQLHLCVIYLFGGLSKARGQTWWDGTAMWYAIGNYEYQSLDTTWLVRYPRIFTAMTHLTLFWEVFYCALVWPRLTRPLAIGLAVVVHAGIATFLGMITFGTMMIAANMIFVEPTFVVRLLGRSRESCRDDEELGACNANADGSLDRGAGHAAANAKCEASMAEREEELRLATERLTAKRERMRAREAKYRDRVRRLKEREGKIKSLIERRRRRQPSSEDSVDSP
jgi:hypothetical protein